MMLRAIHFEDRDELRRKKLPGSFWLSQPEDDGTQFFWYICPSGSGDLLVIMVGNGFKPDEAPSWKWNGSWTEPTLSPSVHYRDHYHGWLQDGYWKECG